MKRVAGIVIVASLVMAPAMAQVPDEFTNLKLFPKDIGKRELISVMRQFSGALGVRCKHCHVGPDNLEGMDFATDELETKRVTRAMMQMTDRINGTLLPATGRDDTIRVRCVTCHRGLARPEQLDDILAAAAETDGAKGALARYEALRKEHYGAGAYDFSAGTLNGLAETLSENGDMEGAIEVMKLNVERNPDAAYSHIMLGQLYMQTGKKDEAVSMIQRAVELEPGNDYAKRMLERVKSAE